MNISPHLPGGYSPNVPSSYRDKDGNIQKIDPKEVTTFAEVSARPLRNGAASRPTPNPEWTWEKTENIIKRMEQESEMTPAQYDKSMRIEADTIFRSGNGEILAVLYKDGQMMTHASAGVDAHAIALSGEGLSQHEYRAAARNALVAALGSRAIASHYDYKQPAPNVYDIQREEQAYNARRQA